MEEAELVLEGRVAGSSDEFFTNSSCIVGAMRDMVSVRWFESGSEARTRKQRENGH